MTTMDELLARLLDERAIAEQLANYCRAMDRCDHDLGRAVFFPDAEADYGEMYRGSGSGFVDFALAGHLHLTAHLHRISNISIVVDADRAGSETYVDARFRRVHEGVAVELTSCGRFVDQWARRAGRWAITHRRYLHCLDSSRPIEGSRFATGGTRDCADPSYEVLNPARDGA